MRKHSHGNSAALENFDSLPDDARVRVPVVRALFGYSAPTLYRRVQSGHLPRPRKDGAISFWLAGELRAKLAEGAQ